MSLVVMVMAIGAWSEDVVLNCSNLGLTNTTYNTSFSKEYSKITFNSNNVAKKSGGIAIKAGGAFWNSTAIPGKITSINFTALNFSSSTNAKFKLYGGTSSLDKSELIETITADGTVKIDFPSNKSYNYFYIDNIGTRALYFECTISYMVNSSEKYTATFYPGEGQCSVTSLTESAPNSGITLPSCTAKEGMRFVGWSLTDDGTKADAGKAGDSYSLSKDCNLYAVYTNVYTVKFSVDGELSEEKLDEGADVVFPEPKIIENFDFMGWTNTSIVEMTSNKPNFVSQATVSDNMTFYAVYSKNNLTKITSIEDVEDGMYAIVSYDENYYLPNSLATGSCPSIFGVSKSDGELVVKDDMLWKLSITDGKIQFESIANEGNYLWGGSGNDGTRVTTKSGKDNATNEWYLMETTDYGIVIYNKASDPDKRYLSTYGTHDWRNYKSTSATNRAANLYKVTYGGVYYTKFESEIGVSAVGYSTYYNSLSAYTMPEGCEGLTAKYADGTLALNSVYKAGDVVPAGEPLIIRAEKGNYTLNFVASNAKPSTDNDLLGTDESTALEEDETSYFYALSLNQGGDLHSVGFYWMNETGAAFTNGAHKAYLKLAKPAASKIKRFVFADDATAISAVSNAADDAEAIYSVSGACQNTMKKGINIVKAGGQVKKVYVK